MTGPNGGGKSTLLALLLGRLQPTAGARRRSAPRCGSARSTRPAVCCRPDHLLHTFSELVPDWSASEVRTLLAKFGLRREHVLRPAVSLSPGERTRAALALLQARGVNLLVLDEPTNHLDLPAIEQLEQALDRLHRNVAAGHPRPENARAGPIEQTVAGRERRGPGNLILRGGQGPHDEIAASAVPSDTLLRMPGRELLLVRRREVDLVRVSSAACPGGSRIR